MSSRRFSFPIAPLIVLLLAASLAAEPLITEPVFTIGTGDLSTQVAALSPDGRWVAGGTSQGELIVWNEETSAVQFRIMAHKSEIRDLAFSFDSQFLLTCGDDGTARLWNVSQGKQIQSISLPNGARVWQCDFVDDNQAMMAVIESYGTSAMKWSAFKWNINENKTTSLLVYVPIHDFAQIGKWVLIQKGNALQILDTETGTVLYELGITPPVFFDRFRSAALSEDGKRLVTARYDSYSEYSIEYRLEMWDLETNQVVSFMTIPPTQGFKSLAISQDGKKVSISYLSTPNQDYKVILWDIDTNTTKSSTFLYPIGKPKFSPDGSKLSIPGDETIILNTADLTHLKSFSLEEFEVHDFAFAPDAKNLALLSGETVLIYNLELQKVLNSFPLEPNVRGLHYSPDGNRLLTGWDYGSFKSGDGVIIDVSTGEILQKYIGVLGGSYKMGFTPDGSGVLFSSSTNYNLFESDSPTKLGTFQGGGGDFVFTPDGRRLLIVNGGSPTIAYWDVPTRTNLGSLTMPGKIEFVPELTSIVAAVPNANDKVLVGTVRGNIHEFDLNNKTVIRTFSEMGDMYWIDISKDGRFLAAKSNGNVYLYDYADQTLRARIAAHPQYVRRMIFSSDNRYIATIGDENVLKIWDLDALLSSVNFWELY